MKERYEWESKPMAAKPLKSYRYPGSFSYVMIGAKDNADALNEARMAGLPEPPVIDKLEAWDGARYVKATD